MHATPVNNAIPLLCVETLPDGTKVGIVRCEDYEHRKTLPSAVNIKGTIYGLTGWNSDDCVAYYRSDVPMAFVW